MKKNLLIWTVSILLATTISCKTTSSHKCDYQQLSGKWTVTAINGEKIKIRENPYIEFDVKNNKIHGRTGCNIVNGTFVRNAENTCAITIPPAATTMMACPDMEVESRFLKALQNVATYKIKHSTLRLFDSNKKVVLELTKN